MSRAIRAEAAILVAVLVTAAVLLINAHHGYAMRGGASASAPARLFQSWRGTAMTTGRTVPPPGGFIFYCVDFPAECGIGPQAPELIDLTEDAEDKLELVQATVNDEVQPRDNPSHLWEYPIEGYGDCNTYSLEKKRDLIARGLPRSALLFAVAITEMNEGHLVLVARTNRGDLVLDNRVRLVRDWTRLPYQWIKRQSEYNPAMWVEILAPRAPLSDAIESGRMRLPVSFGACGGPTIE